MSDYKPAGWIGEIPGLTGQWRRMPDEMRYRYGAGENTTCPLCLREAAGVPWGGWFTCDYKGCCVALVDTGEVFIRLRSSLAPVR
jgi:hypothetical protein